MVPVVLRIPRRKKTVVMFNTYGENMMVIVMIVKWCCFLLAW